MISKESPHATGHQIPSVADNSTVNPQKTNPFAGSLEEQAKRREEQRKADDPKKANSTEKVASSEVPSDTDSLHMELRKIVKDTQDNEFDRHQKIKAFAEKHGQLISIVKKQVRTIDKELDDVEKEAKKRQDNKAAKCDTEQHQSAGEGKPIIDALPGELHIVVRKAEQALLDADVPVFQRVGVLVRPAVLPTEVKVAETAIAAGSLVIEPVSKAWLAERMNEVATWRKYNERKGGMVRTDCPAKYAEHYLAKKGEWNARVLTGIVEAPTLRRDGSLLIEPGYDPVSGVYLNYTGLPVDVPARPTKDDAIKALAVLKEPFEEFPFVGEVDRSVAISGKLTAITRRTLRTAPYHAFDAPVPGSGKSLLADICAMVATGRVATVSTLGADEIETEKRVGALLIRGVSFINVDNAARSIAGDFLCSLATQETADPRVLGTSTTVTVPTNTAAIVFTGNNLIFKGDMARRVVVCRIDPRCERPDFLQFKRNLHEFVPANRHRLLSAALTILRAYVCAGKPAHGKAPYGSFEQWDALIRGALIWLDQADPLESRERIDRQDPEATKFRALLETWSTVFGDRAVTTHQLLEAAKPDPLKGKHATTEGEALHQALIEAAGNPDGVTVNPSRLGRYVGNHREKMAGNFRLEEGGFFGSRPLWKVCTFAPSAPSTTLRENFRSDETFDRGEEEKEKQNAKNIATAEERCKRCTSCTEPPSGPAPDSKAPGTTLASENPPDLGDGYLDSLVESEQPVADDDVVVL